MIHAVGISWLSLFPKYSCERCFQQMKTAKCFCQAMPLAMIRKTKMGCGFNRYEEDDDEVNDDKDEDAVWFRSTLSMMIY